MSDTGTQAAGLGTRGARYTLLVVWTLGLWSTLVDTLPGEAVAIAVATALQAWCLLVLTTPGQGRLSVPRAAFCAAAAVAAALLAVPTASPPADSWSFNFHTYLLGLLTTRGNVRLGVGGGGLLIVSGIVFGASIGADAAAIAAFVALPIVAFIVGIVWRVAIASALEHERRDLAVASAAALATQAAEAATARDQTLIDDVRAEAAPVLEELRRGVSIGEPEARLIAATEEGIRDRIRSPGLRHPSLDAAVREARLRGVNVTLLGTESTTSPLGDVLALDVADILGRVEHGTVTVREHPTGRSTAVSVVVSSGEESHRFSLGAPPRERR